MTELVLYDNTRISDFRRCARYFFYRHVLHWAPDRKSAPLVFGGAWHKAMELVWEKGTVAGANKEEIADEAYEWFIEDWCESGMPHPSDIDFDMQKDLSPRTPMHAQEMIIAYLDKRWDAFQRGDFLVKEIEHGFAVPLDPDDSSLFYIGKIDKIVQCAPRNNKIVGIEHKTTTAYKKNEFGPKFRPIFMESFSPNSQVNGYLYALHLTYPGNVGGIWVDGALVHRTEEDFIFIPIEQQMEQLNAWLWDTRSWIDLIEGNKAALDNASEDDPYMAAFPKNTNSCFDFNVACPYIDLCRGMPNPLGRGTPNGFTKTVWNPLDHINMKDILDD